jgi:hypothetical protein
MLDVSKGAIENAGRTTVRFALELLDAAVPAMAEISRDTSG